MDTIKTFVIDIDISNVDLLYDYGHEEYMRRPGGGNWNMAEIAERQNEYQLDAQSDMCKQRVEMMDKLTHDKRFMEKEKKQFESYNDEAGASNVVRTRDILPKRVLPVYKPGDTVKGHVVLDVSGKFKAEVIKLNFKGGAKVYYERNEKDKTDEKEKDKKGKKDQKEKKNEQKNKDKQDQKDHEDQAKEKEMMEEKDNNEKSFSESESDDDDNTTEETFLEQTTIVWQKNVVNVETEHSTHSLKNFTPGCHVLPFYFIIPDNVLGSIPNLTNTTKKPAYILYSLKATISRFMTRNIICHKSIWITRPKDIATFTEDHHQICDVRNFKTGLTNSGKVSIKCILPKRAFIRGDTIPVTIDINSSSANPVGEISSYVKLSTGLKASLFSSSWKQLKGLSVKDKVAVPAHTITRMNLNVPLDFSDTHVDSNVIPTESCYVFVIKYELMVTVKRSGLHSNIEYIIPLVIGTEDSLSTVTESEVPECTTNDTSIVDDTCMMPMESQAAAVVPSTCEDAPPSYADLIKELQTISTD